MTGPVNTKLVRRFEAQRIAEAILGDGEMFIPDVDDPTSHDRILVLGQLAAWANQNGQRAQAQEGISDSIGRSMTRGDMRQALDIVWCLLIIADSTKADLPVAWASIREQLSQVVGTDEHDHQGWANTVLQRLDTRLGEARL